MALRVTRCMKSPAPPKLSLSACSVLSGFVISRIVSRWRRLAVALRWLALAGVATPVQAAEGVSESIEQLRSRDYPAYKVAISRLQEKGAEAVPELLAAIESRDWPLVNGAMETLARIGKAAVPVLIQAARNGKASAIEALIELGPDAEDALPFLREKLMENPPGNARDVTSALAVMGKPAVPALLAGLKHPNHEVRYLCVSRLGWVGPAAQDAVPELIALLGADPDIQDRATHSLRRIRFESKDLESQLLGRIASPDPAVRQGAVLGLSAAQEPGADTLRGVLRLVQSDPDPAVRSVAMRSLPWLAPGDDDAVRALVSVVARETDFTLVQTAAMTLAGMDSGSRAAVELATLLQHPTPGTRAMAALALGMIGPEARLTIPRLRERLSDPDPGVCSEAAGALSRMGPDARDAAPEIAAAMAEQRIPVAGAVLALERLASPDPSVASNLTAQLRARLLEQQKRMDLGKPPLRGRQPRSEIADLVAALGACGPAARDALPLILPLADDEERELRVVVISAVAGIAPETRQALALALRGLAESDLSVRVRAVQSLGRLVKFDSEIMPRLTPGLQDDNEGFRIACLEALWRLRGKDAAPDLLQALRDRSATLRIGAAHALLTVQPGNRTAWEALMEELHNHWAGPRSEAAWKLGELGTQARDAVEPLMDRLDDRFDVVRAAAAQALGRIGPAATVAVEKLKTASRDPEINVRKEALLALQRLTHLPGQPRPVAESGLGSTNGWAWKASGPLLLPGPTGGETWLSLKDPSVVRHHDRWHLFCTVRGTRRSHAILHTSFAEWAEAQTAPRQILNCHTGYFCAPQVFFFTPRQEWYLVCQASDPSWTPQYQPAFATTKKVEDPGGWSPLRPMWTDPSTAPKAWLDFWVICDRRKAHLFYTSLDGKMWRAETALDRFPLGWSPPVLAIEGDIFEASHTYRLRGMNRYLTFVEAQDGHGWRYFKSFVADQLEGPWIPQAAERDPAFASMRNVSQPSPRWTDVISHGELLRSGVDEYLEIEPDSLRLVFQGVLDSDRAGQPYGQIPWRLGLLESTSVPALR
jgi:HEAT repeat protein